MKKKERKKRKKKNEKEERKKAKGKKNVIFALESLKHPNVCRTLNRIIINCI